MDDAEHYEDIMRKRVQDNLDTPSITLPAAAGQGYEALNIDDLRILMKSCAFSMHLACDKANIAEVHSLFAKLEALHHALRKKTLIQANTEFLNHQS